jgi:tetratricopeptide (TPR) repeat protein
VALLRGKEFAAAETDFTQVLKLEPARTWARLDRALAREGMGDLAGALEDLTAAWSEGLGPPRLFFFRARVKRRLKDEAGAQADIAEGMRREAWDDRDFVTRGLARRVKEPHAALRDMDEALKLNPASRAALMGKANILAEYLGEQEKARAVLDETLKLYPDHAPALAGQAVVLARLGKRKEAHEAIARALECDTGGETRYQAACVFAWTAKKEPSDGDTAMRHLRLAVEARYGLAYLAAEADKVPVAGRPRDTDLGGLVGRPDFAALAAAALELLK